MLNHFKSAGRLALVAVLLCTSSQAFASGGQSYHVTITNLTHSITFTPILVASHRRSVTVFEFNSLEEAKVARCEFIRGTWVDSQDTCLCPGDATWDAQDYMCTNK
jgi:hypothetical protein